jgi:hypothetical protein
MNIVKNTENIPKCFHKYLDEEDESEENICLITHEPLDNTKITLSCNHSFNYIPLYNEIMIQKTKKNFKEVCKLTNKQIKCPYCRCKHNYILPYREEDNIELIYGVTYPKKWGYLPNKCVYVKRDGSICDKPCLDSYCNYHNKILEKKKENSEKMLCKEIIKTGNRKGLLCNRVCKEGTMCGYHVNYYNKHNSK